MHESSLPVDEVTTRERIPVTTVSRTLLDLASVLNVRELERACNEAEIQPVADALSLRELIERHPHRPGVRNARSVLTDMQNGARVERSELERRFRRFLHAVDLPRAQLNRPIEINGKWIECDCVWPAQRVIAELDGRAVHRTALAFEQDRERDRELQAAGWRVIRITWKQLHQDAESVARDLRAILGKNTP
jgi:very-short-patch-repair endonuclease